MGVQAAQPPVAMLNQGHPEKSKQVCPALFSANQFNAGGLSTANPWHKTKHLPIRSTN